MMTKSMTDALFMRRAMELARMGQGKVAPNPMVGCVVVHENVIIGEGFHEEYGKAHAEVNAIHSVEREDLLPESTIYVTLEPCSHHGKTPPCADLLVRKAVRRVVICNIDPNPKVAGKGIERMRNAGIQVDLGVEEKAGRELNKRFFTFHEKFRPYVILKWAETRDGFVARTNFDSQWISNAYSRQLVHSWRAEEAAIMVATNTAKYDNPSLNVRDWSGNDPVRIVIDRDLRLEDSLHLFDTSQRTLVITENEDKAARKAGLEHLQVVDTYPKSILSALYEQEILSVIVEGGSQILRAFIDSGIWDEARVFVSDTRFGEGIKAPNLAQNAIKEENVQGDVLRHYLNQCLRN